MVAGEGNPIYGPFFGVMGAASAIILSGMYLIQDGRFLGYTGIIDFFRCTNFDLLLSSTSVLVDQLFGRNERKLKCHRRREYRLRLPHPTPFQSYFTQPSLP